MGQMEGGKRVLAGDVCWFSERFYLRQTRRRDGADGFDIGNEKPLASGRNPAVDTYRYTRASAAK